MYFRYAWQKTEAMRLMERWVELLLAWNTRLYLWISKIEMLNSRDITFDYDWLLSLVPLLIGFHSFKLLNVHWGHMLFIEISGNILTCSHFPVTIGMALHSPNPWDILQTQCRYWLSCCFRFATSSLIFSFSFGTHGWRFAWLIHILISVHLSV